METGDRKLNEVKKVTDMAYVPVIMADGSVGQIAKSDLASVVAGVLSTKANTPLLHHEGSLYSAENPFDIDSFYMGIVTLNKSSWSNHPVNVGTAPQEDMRGTLFAYRNDNGSGFFGSQVFTSLDNVAYIRNFWGNTMGAWQRLDNFGCNSLEELAGGVAGVIGYNKIAFPITDSRAWYRILTIPAQGHSVHDIYLTTYANQSGCHVQVMTYSDSSRADVDYKVILGTLDVDNQYLPAIKYKVENGVVSIWARLAESSRLGYIQRMVSNVNCTYPMMNEEPPTDAVSFVVE